ncbi:MAG: lamin tail domain-containing protein [Chitinispirillaceae bacterium]|nr:lamin tail domain-containing protein [Chitinispirillaceae bacterium]
MVLQKQINSSSVKAVSVVAAALVLVSFGSCGRMPLSVSDKATGSLEIRTCILKNGLSKAGLAKIGFCDSLIVEVSAGDMATLRYSAPFDLSSPVNSQTIANIPAGTNRTVRVWTVDKADSIIHIDSLVHEGVRIEPRSVTPVTVLLIPAVGSLFLQIDNIPTTVDSVFASFTSAGRQPWTARAKRASKLFLSLEKIPHNCRGLLAVAAVGQGGDTLYCASKEITFNAYAMENVVLTFTSAQGTISVDMTVVLPGITSVSGSITNTDSSLTETGELLITEVMYAANDSEYIEVYNPGESDAAYDTLIIDLDGTYRIFEGVTITAKQAFVFGRKALDWTDRAHPTASALDLSGNGNRISIRAKDGRLLDRVIFTGGSNAQEWPNVSGKRSIALDQNINDARLNNFGRNWKEATDQIAGTETQFGTPRTR